MNDQQIDDIFSSAIEDSDNLILEDSDNIPISYEQAIGFMNWQTTAIAHAIAFCTPREDIVSEQDLFNRVNKIKGKINGRMQGNRGEGNCLTVSDIKYAYLNTVKACHEILRN